MLGHSGGVRWLAGACTRPWRRGTPAPLLGVDIGAEAVTVLELAGDVDRRVRHFACEALPPGAVVDGAIVMPERVATALGQAWRASGTQTRRAATALAGPVASVRRLWLAQGLASQDLEAELELEAGRHMPFALAEIGLDHALLGADPARPGQVQVMLAAARQAAIAACRSVLGQAGLQAVIVDVDSLALERAFAWLGRTQAGWGQGLVALVEAGPCWLRLRVLRDGGCCHGREQPHRAGAGEAALAEQVEQVERWLQWFQASEAAGRIDRLLVVAAGTPAARLPAVLAARLDMPVAVLDPLRGQATADAGPAPASGSALACMVALGLALRRFG